VCVGVCECECVATNKKVYLETENGTNK